MKCWPSFPPLSAIQIWYVLASVLFSWSTLGIWIKIKKKKNLISLHKVVRLCAKRWTGLGIDLCRVCCTVRKSFSDLPAYRSM
jgi:hypothetical protein